MQQHVVARERPSGMFRKRTRSALSGRDTRRMRRQMGEIQMSDPDKMTDAEIEAQVNKTADDIEALCDEMEKRGLEDDIAIAEAGMEQAARDVEKACADFDKEMSELEKEWKETKEK